MLPHLHLFGTEDHSELPVCFLDVLESVEDPPHVRGIGEAAMNVGYVYDESALSVFKQTVDLPSDGIGERIWAQDASSELAGELDDRGIIHKSDLHLKG